MQRCEKRTNIYYWGGIKIVIVTRVMYESETSHGNLHLSVVQCIKHELNKNFTQEKVEGSTCFELYTTEHVV